MEAEARLLEIQTFGQRISDMIVAEAQAWPADLIVVGAHGRRGLHDVLLGSVADGVVRRASVPVLLVR
jgi:nucleotide-binding universal stress UspA family protein